MKKMVIFIVFIFPAIVLGKMNNNENLRQELWNNVGVELQKPLWGNYLKVKKVRAGSLAEKGSLRRGDKLKSAGSYIVDSSKSRISMMFGDGVSRSTESIKNLEAVEQLLIKSVETTDWPYITGASLELERNSRNGDMFTHGAIRSNGIGIYFGRDKEGYPCITGLLKGGPADREGFRVGDKAISAKVGDKWFTDFDDFIKEVKSRDLGTVVQLDIQRNNEKLYGNLKTELLLEESRVTVEFEDEKK